MKLLKASQIPAFVYEIIKAGCGICAIGHRGYVLGGIEEMDEAQDELARISEAYGDRDFLRFEIIAYLRSLGRYIELGSSAAHWSETEKPN